MTRNRVPRHPRRGSATGGVGFDEQALAHQLWRTDPGRDQPGDIRLRTGDARARHEALCREAGVSLLRPNTHLCRHGPAFARLRGLPASQTRHQEGDRIAVMLPNLPAFPLAMLGIIRAGATQVNVNPLYTPRELEHQLTDAGVKAII